MKGMYLININIFLDQKIIIFSHIPSAQYIRWGLSVAKKRMGIIWFSLENEWTSFFFWSINERVIARLSFTFLHSEQFWIIKVIILYKINQLI